MPTKFLNNTVATLAADLTDSGFSITVSTGEGAKFSANGNVSPSSGIYVWATLSNTAVRTATERVQIVNVVGDVLTIGSRQYGPEPASMAWPTGSTLDVRFCEEASWDLLQNNSGHPSAIRLQSSDGLPEGYIAPGGSFAVNQYLAATRPHTWIINGVPMITRDGWWNTSDLVANGMTGAEAIVTTGYVDLGNMAPWASGGSYIDGDVVRPTTDNGYQYAFWEYLYTPRTTPEAYTGVTTEPTWETSLGNGNEATPSGNDFWVCNGNLNTGVEYNIGSDNGMMYFYPTEIGFICQKHVNVTAAPFISIGKDVANQTSIVNNVQLSNITGAHMRHRFTSIPDVGLTKMHVKVNTKATGTNSQFIGRFYFKGLFIQSRG